MVNLYEFFIKTINRRVKNNKCLDHHSTILPYHKLTRVNYLLVDKVFILVFILFHSPKFSDIWPLDQDSSSRSQGLPLAKLLEKKINKYLCKSRRFISRWIDYVPYIYIHSHVPQNPFWRSILIYHFHETLYSTNIYENSWKRYLSKS